MFSFVKHSEIFIKEINMLLLDWIYADLYFVTLVMLNISEMFIYLDIISMFNVELFFCAI